MYKLKLLFVAGSSLFASSLNCVVLRSYGPRLISSSFSVLLSSQLRTMMSSSEPSSGPFQPVSNQYYKTMRQYQQLLDRITPFMLYRWLGTAALLAIFMLRIVLAQGVCPYFTSAFPCLGVLTISISGILVRTKV